MVIVKNELFSRFVHALTIFTVRITKRYLLHLQELAIQQQLLRAQLDDGHGLVVEVDHQQRVVRHPLAAVQLHGGVLLLAPEPRQRRQVGEAEGQRRLAAGAQRAQHEEDDVRDADPHLHARGISVVHGPGKPQSHVKSRSPRAVGSGVLGTGSGPGAARSSVVGQRDASGGTFRRFSGRMRTERRFVGNV